MEELVRFERELWNQAARLNSREEYDAWEQRCIECIESLEEHSRTKRLRLSIGSRHSLVAHIARLEGLKNTLRTRFVYVGAGHSNTGLLWREIDSAFDSRVLTGVVVNSNYIEPLRFLQDAKDMVLEHVRNSMERHDSLKVNTVFNGEFVAGDKRACKSISTKNCKLFPTSDLQEWYGTRVIELILGSLEEFQERDSGWALSRILNLTVNVNKYNPFHAGCGTELPREIRMKRAVINVHSTDNACFAWAVVAALYPVDKHVERTKQYPHYTTVLNLQEIVFPMKFGQIKKFENLNDVSINIYGIQKNNERNSTIVPLLLTGRKRERHVNLLYVQDPQNNEMGHFAWIKNLSRLVGKQLTKHKEKKYICDR